MIERLHETIVAISSAAVPSALGIVRISGAHAVAIASQMVRLEGGLTFSSAAAWTRLRGDVLLDDELAAPAWFALFRAPRSYTREDLVEIHTVGSPPLLRLVQQRAERLGAVSAQPGEFTARAFLHGGVNLLEAQAVAATINAHNETQLRAARRMATGDATRDLTAAREALAELLALVEADIDFAEEPIEFITPAQLRAPLAELNGMIDRWRRSAQRTERLDPRPRILLFGRPNAGKSTLLNRLSETPRAISSPLAGTTRDILAASVRLGNIEVVLLDAAGLDDSDDEVIAAAREQAMRELEWVDLLCVVIDVTAPRDDGLHALASSLNAPAAVLAANKCDLITEQARHGVISAIRDEWSDAHVVSVCAATGEGIADLRGALARALGDRAATAMGEAQFLTDRQRSAVEVAAAAARRASELSEDILQIVEQADLIAFELREALDHLGMVTGEVTTEDLLGQVFARFCIGK